MQTRLLLPLSTTSPAALWRRGLSLLVLLTLFLRAHAHPAVVNPRSATNVVLASHSTFGAGASPTGSAAPSSREYRPGTLASVPATLRASFAILPTVITQDARYSGAGRATFVGGVTNEGDSPVTQRGFVYGTNATPTLGNSSSTVNDNNQSFYFSSVTVDRNTTYYVRAYATNATGTAYGAILSFTTPNPPLTTPIDADPAPNAVAENAAAGTSVGITATAQEPYRVFPVRCTLTDDAGGRFTIEYDGFSRGFIKVAPGAVLDFETATSYTIVVQAISGVSPSLNSNPQSFTIQLTDVNEFAPVVTTSAGSTTAPELVATIIDPGVTVNDADGTKTLASATVSISSGFVSGQDALLSTPSGNITTSYNPATGILTLTSPAPNATLAQWQAVLRGVRYRNSSSSPTGASRTISFRVNDGTLNSNLATKIVQVQDVPNPSITSFSPASGAVGTSVIVTGSNFTGATAVTFNGAAASSFTVISPTQLTATVPAGATSGPLAVTTPTGTATSTQVFTVITPLTVTSTAPTRNTNVAPRPTNVALTYSLPVTAATAPVVRVFSQQAGGQKAGTTTTSGSTVTVDPAQDFTPGETVLVTSVGSATAAPYVYQFTTQAGTGPGTFGGGNDPAVGSRPQSVAVGDVNGDGNLDLLTANLLGNTVSVRLNNGQGSFSGGQEVSVGNFPISVVVGDVDGDGDLDLLTANNNSNGTVSVRLNNGQGSFSGGQEVSVGIGPRSVVVGDVDGDGDLDLLTANNNSNGTVSVRLNNGQGSFSGGQEVSVGNAPISVVVGDVDGDGDLDLLTANNNSNGTVSVRLNNGQGSFSGGQEVSVGNFPISVVVGDVDGDGDLDLLTANNNSNGTVSVRLNNGQGSFSGSQEVSVGDFPLSVAVGDVDGDGDLDLLTANLLGNTVSVRLNNGQGSFSGSQEVSVGRRPFSVAVGDVDGDGDLDLLTANNNDNGTVSVRLNQVPCTAPTTVAATNLTPTSAQVSFTGNGTASGGYSATATPTSGGAPISITGPASPLTLTGLAPNTAYSVVVSSLCDGGLTATSAPPVTFTTPCEAPVLTVSAPQTLAADAGQCSATRSFAASATGTPAPSVSYAVGSMPITFPYAFPVGTTPVTVTATSCGGSDTKTFTVQVQDQQAPVVLTRNSSVTLVNGMASLTAAQVDNGSTDNCTTATRTVSPSTFTCANIGNNQVTLTVTDAAGNRSTATATVTVNGSVPTPTIAVSPSRTIYLGFGPQTATLTASGGGTGATYRWSPATNLSSTTSAAPTFTARTAGSFTYSVTVTSSSGCVASTSVTLTVIDARCGNRNDKVLVCHNGNTLCIGREGVADHLNHGDQLGACPGSSRPLATSSSVSASSLGSNLEAYPNPFTSTTTVRFRAAQAGRVQLLVYNALGQKVATLYEGTVSTGQVLERTLDGTGLSGGLYTCRLLGTDQTLTQRLVLTK